MSTSGSGAAFLRETAVGIVLTLKVIPRSSVNAVAGVQADALKLKITAPPVDSAANAEVVRFLAQVLDVPRSAVQLLRGATSRHKQVQVVGLSGSQLLQRLKPMLETE
ncbi:MAG: hypothetical protein RIS24_2054 [Verrucomicrobiota bacterium]